RLDYVAPMKPGDAFVLGGGKIFGIERTPPGQIVFGVYNENGRLFLHPPNVSPPPPHLGAPPPLILWFEEREKLMMFCERASGARMHANYFRVGGVHQDLPPKLIDDIGNFCDPFLKVCDDIDVLLTENRIFKQRNVNIGVVSLDDVWPRG